MTEEQRKTAAQWLVDFYSAVTQGKTVQVEGASGEWIDCHTVDYWPGIGSALNSKHEWRIKPEPRRKWETSSTETYNPLVAAEWRKQGFTVTEWQEVI
jgi:hypothetical protein